MSVPIPPPNPDDLARDLAADLETYHRLASECPEWVGGTIRESDLAILARTALTAYIRRCAAAAAEVDRLWKRVQELEREVSRLEDHLQ